MKEIQKAKHGLGKNCENPPQDFLTRIQIIWFSLWNCRQEIGARIGKRFSVDERKRKHQASERKVSWRQYIWCREASVFKELGWNNKKISDKRDVCKSDIKTKEKICWWWVTQRDFRICVLFPFKRHNWLDFPPPRVVRNPTTWWAAVQVVWNLTTWWEIWPPAAVKKKY